MSESPRDQLLKRAEIDITRLPEEWRMQPQRVFGAELMCADASLAVSKAKLAVEKKAAELGKQFRAFGINLPSPTPGGEPIHIKVTEGSIEEAIRTDGEYINLVSDLHEKQYHLDLVRALAGMERTKLTSLKYLTTLTAPFSGDPEGDEDVRRVGQEAARAAAERAHHAAA